MSATSGDSAAASVYVAVSVQDAFEVFTGEIDLWWRGGLKFRIAGARPGRLNFEQRLGGRLFETVQFADGERTFEVGSVVVWEPPLRVALEWRNVNFKPHEKTLVEVTFTPSGPGTMVRVEHRGWSTLPDGHPARHGLVDAAFSRMIGMWWGDLLASLREHVSTRHAPTEP
ncbi:MAG TPA: SRPBCC domain-containing protein [Polyangiaceae bacterium]|nr:SRPBCC domain-containing protein [Polyangiaceae bacterium]HMR74357.1 SRPBCC domain-containing protein [Polyangiaceae bacterium]